MRNTISTIPKATASNGYVRGASTLVGIRKMNGFPSPRLGIRFDLSGPELLVRYPDGRPFLTFEQLDAERQQQKQLADLAEQRADLAEQRADLAEQRADRLAELSDKLLRQEATAEELQELQRLLQRPG